MRMLVARAARDGARPLPRRALDHVFDRELFELLLAALLDGEWARVAAALIARRGGPSWPSQRRRAFVAQPVAEAAGDRGRRRRVQPRARPRGAVRAAARPALARSLPDAASTRAARRASRSCASRSRPARARSTTRCTTTTRSPPTTPRWRRADAGAGALRGHPSPPAASRISEAAPFLARVAPAASPGPSTGAPIVVDRPRPR